MSAARTDLVNALTLSSSKGQRSHFDKLNVSAFGVVPWFTIPA
jgi:hypothetical protein